MQRSRASREMVVAGVLWGTIGPAAAVIDEQTSLSPLQTSFLVVSGLAYALYFSGS